MDENKELLKAIREVINRLGMDKQEVKEEGIPEALFNILKSQTYLPVRAIKQEWLEEEKIYKELGSVKNNGKEPETYSEEQDYYLPSDEFLKEIFDE